MTQLLSTHCRLLYVDDDPKQCAIFRRLFGLSGLAVTVAATVAEAKAAVRESRFDVVVIDLHLGGELGTHLAARLHESLPDAVFFLVTGADIESIETGPATEILRGIFPKPFVFQDLLAKIEVELDKRGRHSLAVLRRVLMVGGDQRSQCLLSTTVVIEHVNDLTEAMPCLHRSRFDALALCLPDTSAQSLEILGRLRAAAPETALVVLSPNLDDDRIAWLLRHGAEEVVEAGADLSLLVRAASLACDRKSAQRHLLHQARRDALTGLVNRIGFAEHFDHSRSSGIRSDAQLAIGFIDLDGFKEVNDQFGHESGDAVLVEVARRFRGVIRECDTLARTGGDEFLLLVEGAHSEAELTPLCERLEQAVSEPFLIRDSQIHIGASIGFAMAKAREARFEELVREADARMYRIKRGHKAGTTSAPLLSRVVQQLPRALGRSTIDAR